MQGIKYPPENQVDVEEAQGAGVQEDEELDYPDEL